MIYDKVQHFDLVFSEYQEVGSNNIDFTREYMQRVNQQLREANNGKPVIRAKANRVATGNTIVNPATGKEESEYKFEHAGWERVVKIEVVVEAL